MIKKCIGCGSKLQTQNPNQKGYVKEITDKLYCERCFRLIHYHELNGAYNKVNKNSILKKLNKETGICFFLCDILNFSDEAIELYKNINMPKYFVVSKCDIIPKNISYDKIKSWLKNYWDIKEEIIFVSTKYSHGLNKIKEKINLSKTNIYFAGMTNTGKSSLLNKLFNYNSLTVSELPNTTLDFVKLPIKELNVYDTAGFPYDFTPNLNILKDSNIKKEIKPKNMPLKKDASLLIPDIVRIKALDNCDITCFFSNNLTLKKIYDNNNTYLDEKYLLIETKGMTNIFLKGLGFFYIKKPAKIMLYHVSPKMLTVYPSFIGGNYE